MQTAMVVGMWDWSRCRYEGHKLQKMGVRFENTMRVVETGLIFLGWGIGIDAWSPKCPKQPYLALVALGWRGYDIFNEYDSLPHFRKRAAFEEDTTALISQALLIAVSGGTVSGDGT